MMIKPEINQMLEKAESRFALVIATAKRARQLTDGSTPLVDENYAKPVTIAANEIFEEKISVVPSDEMHERQEQYQRELEAIAAYEAEMAVEAGETEDIAEIAETAELSDTNEVAETPEVAEDAVINDVIAEDAEA